MTIKNYSTLLLLAASITLAGCQTTTTTPSKDTPQYEKIMTMQADINSDNDGVFDSIDACPETPLHIVVDAKGCPIVVDVGGKPDIEMRNLFGPLSSQLLYSYDKEFAKIEEILNEYPDIRVLIFGHATSNELALLPRTDDLSRRRANAVKNRLITKHHIAPSRIATYDCSDRYPSIKTDLQHSDLENIESKSRRVTFKASTRVKDLADIDNVSDQDEYEDYIKYCPSF